MGASHLRYGIEDIKAVMFDLDGTIYYGSKIIPGANDTIKFFRDNGVEVFFTTNNSTKTRKQIFDRLLAMGIDCRLEEVLTSGYLAAIYALKNNFTDLYIFGSDDLVSEFEDMGITVCQDETASNLLIGYDPGMTYEGLTSALQVALNANVIMACNKEKVYPGENARLMPGCGAMTAPIEWCASRECDVVIGKPSTLMVDMISDEWDIEPRNILVIGDTYESDILMARKASCRAILLSDMPYRGVPTVKAIGDVPSLFGAE